MIGKVKGGRFMTKTEFFYPSADGIHRIHAVRWEPDGAVKAVLLLAHGMAEYIDRYEILADALTKEGILVTGNDHLGHGQSIKDLSERGYFAEKDGNGCLLSDMEELRKITVERFPSVPVFLFGHSMGSFLARQYMAVSGDRLSGAILAGTGHQSGVLMAVARALCRGIALAKGWKHRSAFVNGLAFGKYNERFGEKGGFEWLTANPEIIRKYNGDPLCGFVFTLNGFYNMFTSIGRLSKESYLRNMPAELPVLLVSGTMDPVGDYGKGPAFVKAQLKRLGMKDVTLLMYPGARHELINESVRETLFSDLSDWIRGRLRKTEE